MDATTPAPLDQPMSAMERTSVFEETFGAFYDSTVAEARNDRRAKFNAAPFMTDLNQIATTLAGLGVVMRIVTANGVSHDNFDPEDMNSEVPLSRVAENSITAMVASVCDLLAQRIGHTASGYNTQVQS